MPELDLKAILAEITKAEEEVKELQAKVESLKNSFSTRQAMNQSEEATTNVKLKHRISILRQSIEEEESKLKQPRLSAEERVSKGIREALSVVFSDAIGTAYPGVSIATPVVPSTRPNFGDYQCNAAMQIANVLKTQGAKTSPMEVATSIFEKLRPCEMIDRVEKVQPGFLNIWLSKGFCEEQVRKLVVDGVAPPPLEKRLRVVVDFSSPNIAKEMHVGHLRSTIIGDSICRLLEFLGHDVLRLNHVGDWGTQFGMLIAHLKEKFPDYLTSAPPISDLQAFYKESKARFDSDPEFKTKAYASVVSLQKHDPDHIKAWNLICDVSRKEFQLVYDRLGVRLTERGESFYQSRMEEVVAELESKGLLEEDEGRRMLFPTKRGADGLIPMTVVKSDGGFTYDTSDLAAIKQRIREEGADWLVYVTDAGQSTHFKVLFDCAQKAGLLDTSKTRVDHVGFGVVLGEDKKKFKTRSGESVRLGDLLEEGLRRAGEKLAEKERGSVLSEAELAAAREAVAYGCVKYADLSHNRINDYVFSFDKMLDDRGNTAVYLLYALVRIRSIARNAGVPQEEIRAAAGAKPLDISHEKEWKLVKTLLKFKEVLQRAAEDLLLHPLCEFLYEVATCFTEFYDSCQCVIKDKATGGPATVVMDRLVLCEATALTMETLFSLLGLKTVARM